MNRNDFENLIEHGRVTTLDAALFDAAHERALALRSAALRDSARRLRRRLSVSATRGGVAILLVGGALVAGGLLLDRDDAGAERTVPVGAAGSLDTAGVA